MPRIIVKRGKKRWRAAVMVNGERRSRFFPDATRESKQLAVIWEKEMREKLLSDQIDTDCCKLMMWAEEYLDYHKGCDQAMIQAVLRHKKPTTTNQYLRSLGVEGIRKALEGKLNIPAKIIHFSEQACEG